jgi:hypothetical protein
MIFDRRKKERRAPIDRPEKPDRRKDERRKWRYGVLFRTRLPMTTIEKWLDKYAKGRWSVSLEDIDTKKRQKTLLLSFELEADKKMLIANFSPKSKDK